MTLDFRRVRDAEVAADDAADMDEAMSGDSPSDVPEDVPADETVCCPKCNHEFTVDEGVEHEAEYAQDAPPVADVVAAEDVLGDEPSGFTYGG